MQEASLPNWAILSDVNVTFKLAMGSKGEAFFSAITAPRFRSSRT